jgi:RND superfamily putative drug exporter
MFKRLGSWVSAHWIIVLASWAVAVAALHWVAPRWDDITLDGEFAYLPGRMTSVRGQKLLEAAFPESANNKSQVVLVVARENGPLQEPDYEVADRLASEADRLVHELAPKQGDQGLITGVWSYKTPVIGDRLVSHPSASNPGQAALIVLLMRNEFMTINNMSLVESFSHRLDAIRHQPDFPKGLDLGITGSAALGAETLFSAGESIHNTELTTICLVIVILLLVYRAPGLVIIPLVTIGVSVSVSENLVAMLAQASAHLSWFDFKVFKTTEIFIIVILFGAGTDFCLFLVARYREELEHGFQPREGIAYALGQVGGALAGSAMTTILGLGMMYFADFGKYRNGGPAIALCLAVALLACVTLAPALLRATGRMVFWPFGIKVHTQPDAPDNAEDVISPSLRGGLWDRLGRVIIARPGTILAASLLLFAPLAIKGFSVNVSYDLFAELKRDKPSVRGTELLRRYFQPGETGPITILAFQPHARFDLPFGNPKSSQGQIDELTKELYHLPYTDSQGRCWPGTEDAQRRHLGAIISVRSLTEPLGDPPGRRIYNPFTQAGKRRLVVLKHPQVKATYLSQTGVYANCVTRLDLVTQYDPFSKENVRLLDYIDKQLSVLKADPQSRWYQAEFELVGTTPGIRDLQYVTSADQTLIQRLVVLAVLAVLIVLLWHPVICLFLIFSVLFSYFITIGVTELFFAWLDGSSFVGLDWKVPLFLFVILIAVGQDYNIYLVTRVFEEQRRFGPLAGLRRALTHTGGIITSCGVIMAGTFVSMTTGTLRGMQELGFALSFGVMLDTLVIRTIVVPAFIAGWERITARGSTTGVESSSGAVPARVDGRRLRARSNQSSIV